MKKKLLLCSILVSFLIASGCYKEEGANSYSLRSAFAGYSLTLMGNVEILFSDPNGKASKETFWIKYKNPLSEFYGEEYIHQNFYEVTEGLLFSSEIDEEETQKRLSEEMPSYSLFAKVGNGKVEVASSIYDVSYKHLTDVEKRVAKLDLGKWYYVVFSAGASSKVFVPWRLCEVKKNGK